MSGDLRVNPWLALRGALLCLEDRLRALRALGLGVWTALARKHLARLEALGGELTREAREMQTLVAYYHSKGRISDSARDQLMALASEMEMEAQTGDVIG